MFWVWLAVAFLSGSFIGFVGGALLVTYSASNDRYDYMDHGRFDD